MRSVGLAKQPHHLLLWWGLSQVFCPYGKGWMSSRALAVRDATGYVERQDMQVHRHSKPVIEIANHFHTSWLVNSTRACAQKRPSDVA